MKPTSRRPQSVSRMAAAVAFAALAIPSMALAQGQIDAGRSNDASNRIGSGGRNATGIATSVYSNTIVNNGNRVVTGNVTMGREFRDNVGYADPFAFRGTTAGATSDSFIKNSAGVPLGNAPEPIPNRSTAFYGASQTVQAPPGFAMSGNQNGFVPATLSGQRPQQDHRLGIVDLNQPMSSLPVPGEMITRGSLNPQQAAAAAAGILTGSSLYGVREWNPADPADRDFIQNLVNRQNGVLNRSRLDPRDVQRMREELDKAIGSDPQSSNGAVRSPDALSLSPYGKTFDSPGNAALANKPLSDQVGGGPLGSGQGGVEPGMRYNVLGAARKTSAQYAELNKRLEQYYTDRRKTDADFARDFNADLRKRDADAKAAAAAKAAKAAGTADVAPVKPADPTKPDPAADPTKPKVKKPQPVKIKTLAEGVRGEGLGNVLKRAEGLMKEGKFASALDQYDSAEAVTPNNPLIWLGRANAELGAGFFGRADAHLHQAFNSDKALLMGQYDLTGMLGEDRLTKVVGELKDIANKNPTQPMAVFLLAYVAYNTGHERQALGYLDMAEKRGGDQAGFFKALRDHWSLPEAEGAAKPDGAGTPKATPQTTTPEQNK